MKTFVVCPIRLGFFILFLSSQVIAQSDSAEIELLRQRLIDDALVEKGFLNRTNQYSVSDFENAVDHLRSLQSDGSWSDIDYQDRDNSWDPLQALNRILILTYAYSQSSNELYHNAEALAGIESALEYWYQVNPTCKNWYKNEIAKQFYFNVIALLLQDEISEELLQNIIRDLTPAPRMTGSNRTLLSISVLYRGVLEKNPKRIADGVAGVMQPIQITDNEGIQPDYSFHQHGAFLYNGGYGSRFLRETIWLASIVEGTQFTFTDAHLEILRNYYLKGTRWMLFRNVFDYNVRGRQVGRSEGFNPQAKRVIPQLDNFIKADPANAELYQESKQRILNKQPQAVQGNKHFWRSDYTVHHRDNYFISLKMCSKRTVGMEMDINTENLYGYYLPFGLTYIYRRGDEYEDVFPVWDWACLPGVTSPHHEFSSKGRSSQDVAFVGGVSDSTYGVSSMQLDMKNTQAKKSWFWFDSEWVALGVGIKSKNEHPIVTGVNQVRLVGDVFVDGNHFSSRNKTLENPGWVWHDSIGYVFPRQETMKLRTGEREGQLQKIFKLGADSIYRSNLFSLWFEHGLQPENETYEYAVVPNCNPEELAGYADDLPYQVVSNTSQVQAISHSDLRITGIVFHEQGRVSLADGLTILVNKPCLLLINQVKNTITVSDPTARLKQLEIKVNTASSRRVTQKIKLPQDQFAGSSVTVRIGG
ncbi:polysaccharide lyase 8 family protein [Tunicatimonas pelagia]|uniref:polysaccharide lyase 8 family protein n=1 Tax=Tunicatimonas pelagia TaxID=931531 RepID=UPI002664E654|nr:polysaccharide lyase 8 family protein [Tunicatimonas pelagia]WKN40875.1 polysaccharide lyase 8 family protein [Tunicatimonas pelagia]